MYIFSIGLLLVFILFLLFRRRYHYVLIGLPGIILMWIPQPFHQYLYLTLSEKET
jgi:hypothetical protein